MDKILFENRMREKDKSYSEMFAKALLALEYDPNFVYAQNDECPDIQLNKKGKSHGVEVTRLICSYFVTLKKYVKAWSHKKLTIEEIATQIPPELQNAIGVNASGKVVPMRSLGEKVGCEKMKKQIAKLFESKLEKLQHYEQFDQNSLFMFATELNPSLNAKKILSSLMNKSHIANYNIHYDNIFVFTYNSLILYEKQEGHYYTREIPISEETIAICDKYARYAKKQNMDHILIQKEESEIEK